MSRSRRLFLSSRVAGWLVVASLLTSLLAVACFGSGGVIAAEPSDDVAPPVISDVTAVDITATGATITWTTDELATSQVQYGWFPPFYTSSPLNSSLTLSHGVTLAGLNVGTTYYYRVISEDGSGNEARSEDYTFTTAAVTDKDPPKISGEAATGVTATSATIIWTTDEPATSQVDYGTKRTYGSTTPEDATLVTEHMVSLTGLIPNTVYYYRVKSADDSGNAAQSGRLTFRTLDATAPVISDVRAIDVTATSATIIWTTNEPATSQVDYGLTAGYGLTTGLNPALVTSHRMVLSSLAPKAVYYFGVKSADATNNLAQSVGYAFTTADSDAPVITNVAATVTGMSVTFTWTTDDPAQSQVEYGTSPSYGQITEVDYNLVTEHRVSLTGLRPQTTYYYLVKSRDDSGLWAWSEGYTFVTPDVTPPAISGVYATDVTATSATIVWTTSEVATSLVVYGPSASYGSSTSQDMDLVTEHRVSLTGLSPQTTYHYKVKSTDAAQLRAESGDFTFATADIGAPVISGVSAINITMTGATVTWTTDDPGQSQVEYGTKATYGLITVLDTNHVTSHSVVLTDLMPGTTYHYMVKSKDASGLWTLSGDNTFTTVADPTGVVPGSSGATPGPGSDIAGGASSFRMPIWAWAAIGVVVALVLGVMVLREV